MRRKNEQSSKSLCTFNIAYCDGGDGTGNFGKDGYRSWPLGCNGTIFFIFDGNKNGNSRDDM